MRIHMIGICGTGMGSLAGLLADAGHQVGGSDENVYPPISTMLAARGIPILHGYRAENIQQAAVPPDLVIVGNIASRANPEVQALLSSGIDFLSMPQALGRLFLQDRHPVVVTGTHGKTTTTALIAAMLLDAGRDPSFLIGGVVQGEGLSCRLGPAGLDRFFVIEGDEYETSFFDKGSKFLHYRPKTGVLTSVEFDHAEMFADLAAVEEAFARFVALIPTAAEGGRLAWCADDPIASRLASRCRGEHLPYGLSAGARILGNVEEAGQDGTVFSVRDGSKDLGLFKMSATGDHNTRNALAAVAVGLSAGLSVEEIRKGIAAYPGVRRRQEIRGVAAGVTVIDDFAHHPTAVRETIAAIKARFPGRRVWAIFEPRTNTTRRNVFQREYGEAFDHADEVVVAPVDHPERAPEGQRFSVEQVIADLTARGVSARSLSGVDAIVDHIKESARSGDVLLVMSNGAFSGIHDRLLATLATREALGASGACRT